MCYLPRCGTLPSLCCVHQAHIAAMFEVASHLDLITFAQLPCYEGVSEPSAFEITVTSPLNPTILDEAGLTAAEAEKRGKHAAYEVLSCIGYVCL